MKSSPDRQRSTRASVEGDITAQNGLILLAVAMETGFELGGTRGRRKMMPLTARLITPEILAAPHHFSMASTHKSREISLPELSFYEFSVCSNNTFTSIRRSSLKWWDAMTYKFGGVLCGVDKRAVSGIHFLRPPELWRHPSIHAIQEHHPYNRIYARDASMGKRMWEFVGINSSLVMWH